MVSLGSGGLNNRVFTLATFDDGTGPALYAGGLFTISTSIPLSFIARWDGESWAPVGSGVSDITSLSDTVWTLAVFDDGSGPALYAGGHFFKAGGIKANNIARWDGQSWAPAGEGVSGGGFTSGVRALTVFDDGSGPALYAGGFFTTAGGVAANSIAKWDGKSWSPLPSGIGRSVESMAVFDDGSGSALYVGGTFGTANGDVGNRIAKWDGQQWSPLGSGLNGRVRALSVFDDGFGAALYAGGIFTNAGGVAVNNIAKWNGSWWAALGSGVNGTYNPAVHALTVFNDGSGAELYAVGNFLIAGGNEANRIAKWDGRSWSSIGSGMNYSVFASTVFRNGVDPGLIVGGDFTASPAGDARVAKYRGCPPTPLNPADRNGDGVVNGADLAILMTNWGVCKNKNGPCRADLNSDGVVDSTDLAFLLANWG